VELDDAGAGRQHPGQPAQQGRLAARVRPDDDRQLAVRHGHVEAGDDRPLAVADGDLSCGDAGRGIRAHALLLHSRASTQIRYRPPSDPVTTPTGSCDGANRRWATASPPSTRNAPISAAVSRPAPAVPVRRRASCGAARATKAIGPAAAVAIETSATPAITSSRRV